MDSKNCENELKENTNSSKPIEIKFSHLIIMIVIMLIISYGVICFITGKLNFNSIFKKNNISQSQMTEILKGSDNGVYLQDSTVKVGFSTDINYDDYDTLVSYSCVFTHNQVTLNAGGLMLYNTHTKEQEILKLDTSLMSIIYYLNTQNMNNQLNDTTKVIAEYIENYGLESISFKNVDTYMKLGKEIGQIVGVRLCRNISAQAMEKLGAYNPSISTFLYKADEIFPRYMGMNVTEKEYCWYNVLDEKSAQMLSVYNVKTYNQLIALYGNPYKNVTKFTVFDMTKEDTKEVGKYLSKDSAKEKLGVEE